MDAVVFASYKRLSHSTRSIVAETPFPNSFFCLGSDKSVSVHVFFRLYVSPKLFHYFVEKILLGWVRCSY
jgi:hypothetical protein